MYVERIPTLMQAAPAQEAARARSNNEVWRISAFFAAHVALALLMYQSSVVSTLHALLTPAIGLWWTSMGRHLKRAAYVGAYIAGAEVLWRMTGAQVFWEYGKYAAAAFFILAMLRTRRKKETALPFLYFALLLPSVALTVLGADLETARKEVSFNLSGPFALMVSAWFFSHLKLSTKNLGQLFVTFIAPVTGIAAITFFATMGAASLRFRSASNFTTSGGFGPVQVSAVLGLGALVALLSVLDHKSSRAVRTLMFGAMVFLSVQCALTFSRGGLYCAAGGAALAFLFLLRDASARIKFAFVAVLFSALAYFVLLPQLDAFTGGALSARFQDTGVTGRDEIALAELRTWAANPLLGVGPGRAMKLRGVAHNVAAHTEFTRLLAEHGVFGLAAAFLLLFMGARNIKRAPPGMLRAVAASLMCWGFLFISSDAMRLFAPALALGLGFVTFLRESNGAQHIGYKVTERRFSRAPLYRSSLVRYEDGRERTLTRRGQ